MITVFNLTLYERRKDKYNKAQSKIPETHSALLNTPETPDTPFTARPMTQKLVRKNILQSCQHSIAQKTVSLYAYTVIPDSNITAFCECVSVSVSERHYLIPKDQNSM